MNLEGKITINQAATLTHYDPYTLRRLARDGKIKAIKVGRDWWVDETDIRAYKQGGSRRKPYAEQPGRRKARREGK